MTNALRPDLLPSTRCSNISKRTTIANGFIPNWIVLARLRLKPKKSLSRVSVELGQDYIVFTASYAPPIHPPPNPSTLQ